jgi:hypothetical protein
MEFDVSGKRNNFHTFLRFTPMARWIISSTMSKKKKLDSRSPNQGYLAQSEEMTLRTWTVGALPLINRILDRMRLDSFFEELSLPKTQSAPFSKTECGNKCTRPATEAVRRGKDP